MTNEEWYRLADVFAGIKYNLDEMLASIRPDVEEDINEEACALVSQLMYDIGSSVASIHEELEDLLLDK